ncbi:isoleucine--tRNA ligase [Verrucomicrobia bacterium]|nr:isoleucine--tRNA ligase [Verrucomicrobiota bacterium]
MNYKDTLNLPQTGFPMKADLVKREPQRLQAWEQADLYDRIIESRRDREVFLLHDGPPFANGDVHIGTAGNKILKDFILKFQTLKGTHAPYVPGWDCHGLPIEFKVVQELRKKGADMSDVAGIRTACDAYARKYIDLQREQFKRLGVLGCWDKPYLTLNKEYEAAELRMFADLIDQGYVYRGKKPVYWSIPCHTALAEAEVEYQDHVSPSVFVKFKVMGEPNTFVLIWTTTPWTLPANLAVAFNSKLQYSEIQVEDESYILSNGLLDALVEKMGWDNFQITRSLDPDQLEQIEYEHPFCDRSGKLHDADFVDDSTGTGFVHIAPGHGLEDYGLGMRVGLPIYSPVDDRGCLTHTSDLPAEAQMPEEMIGKSILEKKHRSEANEAVIESLKASGHLLLNQKYTHSYPHCWRSKTPVIFRAMDQWFINVDHNDFREKALNEIAHVKWVPEWGRNRIEGAVKSRPDWCISRQRTWGVPIPAFHDADGNPLLDGRIVRKASDLIEKHGSNIWFSESTESLWRQCRPEDWGGAEATAKSSDTLDVWIDSGSSSRSVIMQREELRRNAGLQGDPIAPVWQADLYMEGSDQHRGWFQSSLLLSLSANGSAPYKTVLTHGFMVDADKEKISKSKQGQGAYTKPQTSEAYIGTYGADIVRLWVASQDFRNDIVVSEERVKKVAETYRLLRNSLRFQLSNLYDFEPEKNAVPHDQLTPLDRWMLDAWSRLEQEVYDAFGRFEFHIVYQKVSQFTAVEISSVYHDLVKDRLYSNAAESHARRSTQTVLHHMVRQLCQTLSPMLVFTSDEAWEFIPGVKDGDSVHLQEWKPSNFRLSEQEHADWVRWMALRDQVLAKLEDARREKVIGKSLEAKVTIQLPFDEVNRLENNHTVIREILNVSQLEWIEGESLEIRVTKAEGSKCKRCWHWELDVGNHEEHPEICKRCVDAVESQKVTD